MKAQYGTPDAFACMQSDNSLCGTVKLISHRDGTLIIVDINGLPDTETNFFALHIHEGKDCCGSGFPNTGGHYNPCATTHPQHAGDLPPLLNCGGKAFMAIFTNRFRVKDVIGKTVVIHSHPDDFKTQPSGDAGSKIACGVIRSA